MKWNDPIYDPRLPKANLIHFQWGWHWFRLVYDKVLGKSRFMWKSLFWLPHRYANAFGLYIGHPQELILSRIGHLTPE